jgi:DNA-binding transcriptional ArsR family regulator
MVTIVFTVEDMARLRFAISPMWELMHSLVALRDPSRAALHVPWLRAVSGRLGGLDLRSAAALVPPRGYSPDFLTPPPASPVGDIAEDLATLRATKAADVRREMTVFARTHPRVAAPWIEQPRREVTRLVATLSEYWTRAVEPSWPRIGALLEADIARRAGRLAQAGPRAVLADIHPAVRWRDGALTVDIPFTRTVELGGRGLVLMPSAFAWERPAVIIDAPWQPTVVYPARGVATLWDEGDAVTPEGLARVVGATRAALLVALDAPRSTTELARRTGVTPGGVSQHLGALRAAGLVSRERAGREVLYVRTEIADAIVAA